MSRKVSYLIQWWNSFVFVLDVIQFFVVNTVLSVYYFVKMIFPKKKKDISGQLALITGGGKGLGRSISLALAAKGCNIIILDVDINGAEATAAEIRVLHNVNAFAFLVDVSKFNEVRDIRLHIENEIGTVDILVNNAGILTHISLLEGTPDDIEKVIGVNLVSSFWTIREFIPTMYKRNSGHIVAISSLSAYDALGRQVLYSSTKYALRGLMEALQEELRTEKSSIVATSVFPGFIRTRDDLVAYMDESMKHPSTLKFLSTNQVATKVIDAIIYNKPCVSVPSYYLFLMSLFGLYPAEIQNRYRDKFKPILHKSSDLLKQV